jgi:type I restriction enzyme S subunit
VVAPNGFKQTAYGLLPSDWHVLLLDSVAERGTGHTPDKKRPEYWSGSIKWVSLQDTQRLDRRGISETAESITPLGLANSAAVRHPRGTVILSRDAGVGKSAILEDDMAVSQHFIAWRCGPSLCNQYLYYWLQSRKREFERIAMGNTIKTIGMPYFEGLAVPVPSLAEQQSIAQALSDTDDLIESLERLIEKKRGLKQAAMQQLMTGTVRLPGFAEDWSTMRLADISLVVMGQSPPSRHYNRLGHGVPLVQGNADICDRRSVARTWTTSVTREGRQGDLLLTVRAPVGSVAIASERCCLGRGVCSLMPTKVDPQFLFHALVYAENRWRTLGQGSTFASANGQQIAAFILQMPSQTAEQHEIGTLLSDMDAEIEVLEARLTKTRDLKQGMMQELLTGRTRLV